RSRPLRANPARPGSPPDRGEAATRAGLLRPAPGDTLHRRAAVRGARGTSAPAGPRLAAEVDAIPPVALRPRPPRGARGARGGRCGRGLEGPKLGAALEPAGPRRGPGSPPGPDRYAARRGASCGRAPLPGEADDGRDRRGSGP